MGVMEFFRDIFKKVENLFDSMGLKKYELSDFQKKKLLHEFHTFYDANKDGCLEWKDLNLARENICKMNGWKIDSEKYKHAQELFTEIWRYLQDSADGDFDGKVTEDEWLLMWQGLHRDHLRAVREGKAEDDSIPRWLEKYIEYRFNLYDRTGDGIIDIDEFEYVLGEFGISPRESRSAFTILSKCGVGQAVSPTAPTQDDQGSTEPSEQDAMTSGSTVTVDQQHGERKVDFEYFRELAIEYYRSDDPGALGNFITGKLTFDD
ncbi:unnamed protein product [Owenia fusiformis]|uniref:Uncharacterized protein n=1 Tax=Owenia fusiformis TaxID=6347 RepID=A0A8J1TTY7_OWEFU|nr:unnamed protein product [Owenia fusiformis]